MANAVKYILALGLMLFSGLAYADPPKPAYVTGSPVTGAVVKATGPQAITTGDLSGDVITTGTLVTNLSTTGVTAGTYGDASHIPVLTIDAKGRTTAASTAGISIPSAGGSNGQIQYNASGSFGGFTMAGDCTFSVPNITCTKTNGVNFGYFATGTDASNLTGTVSVNRFNGGSGASTSTFLRGDGTWVTPASGSVTSVALSLPSIFTVSGSPVTSSGTLTGTFNTQTANQIFAGPSSGGAATPTFRALVGADLPNPSASTLGGIESYVSVTHQWLDSISTSGVPHSSQPAFTDISGSASSGQMSTNLSGAIDSAFGSTRGALLERGASGWQIITPGTNNFSLVSNGSGADPSWKLPPAGGNPLVIGPTQIGAAAGIPPTATFCPNTAGEGSLCLQTDSGFLYSMYTPPTVIPAQVQSSAAVQTYTVTLGATPTLGNYLVALCYNMNTGAAVPTLNTGWTSYLTHTSGGFPGEGSSVVAYRKVVTGVGTSESPCTSPPANGGGVNVTEVSGLDMTNFTNSVQFSGYTFVGNNAPQTATEATTSTTSNTLGLSMSFAGNFASGSFTGGNSTPTYNAGWTIGASANQGFSGASTANAVASEQFSSTSSSVSAQATVTSGNFVYVSNYLLLFQPSTNALDTGFQQVSYLSTIKNAGTTLTTNARTVNCSTGTTCTTDADGNVTLTAAGNGGTVTVSGVPTTGHCAQFSAATQITDSGASCGGGGGGGTTNNYYTSAGMTLIASTVTSGSQSSVTFSSLPQNFRDLHVVVTGRGTTAASLISVFEQFNGDTAANYDIEDLQGNNTTAAAFNQNAATGAQICNIAAASATSGIADTCEATIDNYTGTTFQKVGLSSGTIRTGTTAATAYTERYSQWWRSTAAITALKVFPTAGAFVDGTTVSIYGIGASSPTVPNFGNMTVIQEVVTSGSAGSVTFSNIPATYRDLRIVVTGRAIHASTNSESIGVQFNGDTGSNYVDHYVDFQATSATTPAVNTSNTLNQIGYLPGSTSPANTVGMIQFDMGNYAGTSFYKVGSSTERMWYDTSSVFATLRGHTWKSTSAISSIKVFTTDGSTNFVDGAIVTLYGIGGPTLGYPNVVGAMTAAMIMQSFGGL